MSAVQELAVPIGTYRHDVADRPFSVIWEMTQACPLACVHCRAEARPGRHPGELTADEAYNLMAQVAEFGSRPPANVNAAQGFVFISHLGTIHPSGFLPLAAGNVRTGRLAGIYRTSPLFTGLREHSKLTGRRGACEFASVCGGSRSRAFALTGDPYAEDPWCSHQPGTFPYPADLAAMGLRPAA